MKVTFFVLVLLVVAIVFLGRRSEQRVAGRGSDAPAPTTPVTVAAPDPPAAAVARPHAAAGAAAVDDSQGFLYGRVATVAGDTYEGRLRWGGGEEAFWGETFNGTKAANPWAGYVPSERLREPQSPIRIFGFELARRARELDLDRPFMARFGDLARIEGGLREARVTLKSGTVVVLDRFAAGDLDDGVRVWDAGHGVVDVDVLEIRAIDFLPTGRIAPVGGRLHGTVRTAQGDFTGFVQWDRERGAGSDLVPGSGGDGADTALRFDAIDAIVRRDDGGATATLRDGREVVLRGSGAAGDANRGVYVDDRRYGRVLVSWQAFERLDFAANGSGPGYEDFPPGSPLTGSVATRGGERFVGRLVFDLDESETTDTLDAPSGGVDYSVLFGRIAAIVPGGDDVRPSLTLVGGEHLELQAAGDLGAQNGGLLVFADEAQRPAYLPWSDVERIDFAGASTTSSR